MRWHMEERVDTEGVLRHPADAEVWKNFDRQYPDFAKESRNVRLGFATDGFNPFGDLSNSYSMRPMLLIPYNMPPWRCMKQEFLMMALLILGRRAPAYGIVSGYSTQGEYDGTTERRLPPIILTGDEILDKLKGVWKCRPCKNDKIIKDDKQQMNDASYENKTNWKRKSIFWELEYWPKLKLRHNLDVMHIEKNICDSVVGTIFSIDGKSKDTENARLDLQDLNIRNISRNVNMKDGKLFGLKSHDCHILLPRLLPIGQRPYLKKKVMDVIVELSLFFKKLCVRTLYVKDLVELEEGIVFTLCKLESICPSAFFDVLIHLAVHLPLEAKLGGPVQMRWMYSIERELSQLKKYVKNKARPEGSIAKGYIITEALYFCSMYLRGIETRFNLPDRNPGHLGIRKQSTPSIFNLPTRPFGRQSSITLTQDQRNQVQWYILNNYPELEPYLT
ncbi:uncharacterized protein LOC133833091 [Humulus lupulus]|uniref:uncharacterized protein LOC133833091 n=1 Tax=Humulus lupulus TaxID=3486 RepID=UPI002B40A208|nr:uncharacterized protein LOC133833091 [Humulus lupulus]